jgi:hypothetical protein
VPERASRHGSDYTKNLVVTLFRNKESERTNSKYELQYQNDDCLSQYFSHPNPAINVDAIQRLLQISGLFAPLQIVRNLHSAEICKSA